MNAPRQTSEQAVSRLFHTALRPLLGPDTDPFLFPSALAVAARNSTGADGCGLSVFADYRVPIGFASTGALAAEKLQFTVGEGPCLEALEHGRAVRVDEDQMAQEWPAFHDGIRQQTPYRSIVAVPFTLRSGLRAAIDLYFVDARMPRYSTLADAAVVARNVAELLDSADAGPPVDGRDADELPAWVVGKQARQRLRVWIAVGVGVSGWHVNPDEALVRLRAAAFARGQDVDTLAEALINRKVQLRDLDQP